MSNPELNNLLRRHNELTSKSTALMQQLIKAVEFHTDTTNKTMRFQLNNIVDAIEDLKDTISNK